MVFNTLLNPTFAYLLLVAGFWFIIMAMLTPGTGVFEISAFFVLAIAGWQVYNLPINLWALFLLVLGVIPFFIAVRKSGRMLYLGLSVFALVIGSAFLFQGDGWRPAVNPILSLFVSLLTGGFMWLVTVKTLEAQAILPSHDLSTLIGAKGITRTTVHHDGAVLIKKEEWSARSENPIPPASPIKVIAREGFTLHVEPFEQTEPKTE